jgi:16S rRNA (uracil1498-N3)-methyltransferase
MLRLFVPRTAFEGAQLRIAGPELRHLRTLRLGPGDRLLVFDETGEEHEVRIERLGGRVAEASVLASRRAERESSLDLVLAPALLKGTKMDLVVEKAVELGVRHIAPFLSRRALGQGARTERWRRIALAAAKQSARTAVPRIDAPVPLDALMRAPWPGLRLLAWEGEHEQSLATLPAEAAAVVIVVGPEGGFADDEVAGARAQGFVAISLAPRILRAETAAITAAVLCQHRWGDLSSAGRLG